VIEVFNAFWDLLLIVLRAALLGWFVFKMGLIVHSAERILTRKNREQEKEARK